MYCVTYRIVLHSYFNLEFLWHDKFISLDWVKVVSLLVLSSHLVGILLLLLKLKLPLHFHWVHLAHVVGVHHSWVHLMHLSWIHLDHVWVLLVHHLLLYVWIHSLHVHITHWRLLSRYFLLCWLCLFLCWSISFGWWLFLSRGLSFSRWLLITHI